MATIIASSSNFIKHSLTLVIKKFRHGVGLRHPKPDAINLQDTILIGISKFKYSVIAIKCKYDLIIIHYCLSYITSSPSSLPLASRNRGIGQICYAICYTSSSVIYCTSHDIIYCASSKGLNCRKLIRSTYD